MRQLRFPMFVKFLVGCLTLAALLIGGGTFVFKKEAKPPAAGNFLAKHYRRYQGYEERIGRGMSDLLDVIASDTRLRKAVARSSGDVGPPAADESASVASLGEALFARLSAKTSIEPDVLVIFSTKNELLWASGGSPIQKGNLAELAAVEKVRAGSSYQHRPTLLDNVLYQVSASPIRASDDGDVVGGILVGVRVQRYFAEYTEQSDDNPERRVRLVVLRGQDFLASSLPQDQQAAFAKAAQPENYAKVVTADVERIVMRMGATNVDFYSEDLDAYKGGDKTVVGKIFLTRPRTDADESKIPWTEIVIGIVLSISVAFSMAFWITRPIKQFVRQSRELLEGETDLTHRIIVNSRDETADLAENINQVFARVHGLASGVQSASFQVGASSAEISAASKQMLSGIKDQSVKIESSTAAITELSASIQQVAENAAQATDMAEKSNIAVTSAVQRMDQIRSAVDEAGERMRELGESSKRIGNIVEVIRQISEQTSLLALNAAIQAAQAGEHGRGFAVVADEVSSLARRAGQSAKDIEELIQTIKEQTAEAVASMEKGTGEVDSGTQLVQATLGDLGRLIGVVRDTARAVQEQAVVSDEIARNMDSVQSIASEVLTGSEESVLQAERLHELAFQLEESIGGFNLDSAKPASLAPPTPPAPPPAGALPGRPHRALPKRRPGK